MAALTRRGLSAAMTALVPAALAVQCSATMPAHAQGGAIMAFPSPDAELIRLCMEFDMATLRYAVARQAWSDAPDHADGAQTAAFDAAEDEVERLSSLILPIAPCTLAGIAAKATTVSWVVKRMAHHREADAWDQKMIVGFLGDLVEFRAA